VLELGHVLLGRGLLGERPRQHEFGLEHGTGPLNRSIKRRRHPLDHWMLHSPLDVLDGLSGVPLVPVAIEALGYDPELDDQIAREVLRFSLAPFLPPQAEQGSLVRTHDDAGV
jgi:hypothetical protein